MMSIKYCFRQYCLEFHVVILTGTDKITVITKINLYLLSVPIDCLNKVD